MYKCTFNQTNSHHHSRTPVKVLMNWMGKLDYRGTEKEPRIHAFPEKHLEPGTIRGIIFPHQTPFLAICLWNNSFIRASNINKQWEAQNHRDRSLISFRTKGPVSEPAGDVDSTTQTRESTSTGKGLKQRDAFHSGKSPKWGEKVNNETLWSRFPSCAHLQ